MKILRYGLPLLSFLFLSGSALFGKAIAFQNLEVDGKRHALVIVHIKPNQIEYALEGVTHACSFDELPSSLQNAVKPYLEANNPTPESPEELEESEGNIPQLNSEQLAQKAHRDFEEIIKDKLTNPDSFSLISAGFYKNDKGLSLTQRFRAISPKGKKRSYAVSAQTNKNGEILSVDWGNQEL